MGITPGGSATAANTLTVTSPKLWSAASPNLYTVTVSVLGESCSPALPPLDHVEAPHGFRSLRYDANAGFFLNNDHFKVRGFCDHNNFAVVGMAVPDRINLF